MVEYLKLRPDGEYEVAKPITVSTGVSDKDKLIATNEFGVIDQSLLPTTNSSHAIYGILPCTEDLLEGQFVNIYEDNSIAYCRKAIGTSDNSKEAHGFLLNNFLSGSNAIIYFIGLNKFVTGQTIGNVYLSTTPGIGTNVKPFTTSVPIGYAISPTLMMFSINQIFTNISTYNRNTFIFNQLIN